ncbi:MAG: M24 family metallopeptidase [Pirellulales bacterium]
MFDVPRIQEAVRQHGVAGWLLYDFRGQNALARRIVQFPSDGHATRRWLYLIPADGRPRKLVHRIEAGVLDHLPGDKQVYLRWQELEAGIRWLLDAGTPQSAGPKRIAMEYATGISNPYISCVDAGMVEFVRSCGAEVVSSGDLVQQFEATLDDEQWTMHREAARHTEAAFGVAWKYIAERVRADTPLTEIDVQRRIMGFFTEHELVTDHPPIVGVGPHSGDPHYAPTAESNLPIRPGDFVLVDLWAKLAKPRSIYSDLTRVGFVDREVPEKYEQIFQIVAAARDAGIQVVRDAFAASQPLRGYEVDDACRAVIEQSGYGEFFVHRTGHNIGENDHGNGAHMDNLETREERLVVPRTLFSIEPGIYLPEFGVRSEVNVFIDATGGVHVTGGEPQRKVLAILA